MKLKTNKIDKLIKKNRTIQIYEGQTQTTWILTHQL